MAGENGVHVGHTGATRLLGGNERALADAFNQQVEVLREGGLIVAVCTANTITHNNNYIFEETKISIITN